MVGWKDLPLGWCGKGRYKMRQRLTLWIMAWIGLAESIVEIFSFGFVVPHWKLTFLMSDLCERLEGE